MSTSCVQYEDSTTSVISTVPAGSIDPITLASSSAYSGVRAPQRAVVTPGVADAAHIANTDSGRE
jgi:hypothetical protein